MEVNQLAVSQTQIEWTAELEERIVDLESDMIETRKKIDRVKTISEATRVNGTTGQFKVSLLFGLVKIER
jgi:tryptophan 2,3-dioxygenase